MPIGRRRCLFCVPPHPVVVLSSAEGTFLCVSCNMRYRLDGAGGLDPLEQDHDTAEVDSAPLSLAPPRPSAPHPLLCSSCTRSQALIVQALACQEFEEAVPDLQRYLQAKYPLCALCEIATRNRLDGQNRRLRAGLLASALGTQQRGSGGEGGHAAAIATAACCLLVFLRLLYFGLGGALLELAALKICGALRGRSRLLCFVLVALCWWLLPWLSVRDFPIAWLARVFSTQPEPATDRAAREQPIEQLMEQKLFVDRTPRPDPPAKETQRRGAPLARRRHPAPNPVGYRPSVFHSECGLEARVEAFSLS